MFGFYDGTWHENERVEFAFTVDRSYGTDCSALPKVMATLLPDVSGETT